MLIATSGFSQYTQELHEGQPIGLMFLSNIKKLGRNNWVPPQVAEPLNEERIDSSDVVCTLNMVLGVRMVDRILWTRQDDPENPDILSVT